MDNAIKNAAPPITSMTGGGQTFNERQSSIRTSAGSRILVLTDEVGARQRVESQIEADHGGRGVRIRTELLLVDGVHREHIPVRAVPGRRRGTAEVLRPVVVACVDGTLGQSLELPAAGSRGQLGSPRRGCRTGPSARTRSPSGHRGRSRSRRSSWSPAGSPPSAVAERCSRRLDLSVVERGTRLDVLARHRERRHGRMEVMRQRPPLGLGHLGTSKSVDQPIPVQSLEPLRLLPTSASHWCR